VRWQADLRQSGLRLTFTSPRMRIEQLRHQEVRVAGWRISGGLLHADAAGSTNPLSFRAAVKTDAGAAAAANTDGSKVRFARYSPGTRQESCDGPEKHYPKPICK
jgi:hypothetical protein